MQTVPEQVSQKRVVRLLMVFKRFVEFMEKNYDLPENLVTEVKELMGKVDSVAAR